MNRAIALSLTVADRLDAAESARRLVVLGCALSLILAGRAIPF